MTDGGAGQALRLLASRGWTEEDPDVLLDVVRRARELAAMVVADQRATPEVRAAARQLLVHIDEDTAGTV